MVTRLRFIFRINQGKNMKKISICFLAFLLIIQFPAEDFPQPVKGKTVHDRTESVYSLLNRIIPGKASNFRLRLTRDENKSNDNFVVEASDGVVNISGDGTIAQ